MVFLLQPVSPSGGLESESSAFEYRPRTLSENLILVGTDSGMAPSARTRVLGRDPEVATNRYITQTATLKKWK